MNIERLTENQIRDCCAYSGAPSDLAERSSCWVFAMSGELLRAVLEVANQGGCEPPQSAFPRLVDPQLVRVIPSEPRTRVSSCQARQWRQRPDTHPDRAADAVVRRSASDRAAVASRSACHRSQRANARFACRLTGTIASPASVVFKLRHYPGLLRGAFVTVNWYHSPARAIDLT